MFDSRRVRLQTHIMFLPRLKGALPLDAHRPANPVKKGPPSPAESSSSTTSTAPASPSPTRWRRPFSVEPRSGRRGAEEIKDQKYHVVVLDIRMPEMDGIKALEELHKIDPHVSVIILTGYGCSRRAQQAIVGGPTSNMRKPPDVAELIDGPLPGGRRPQLRRSQAKDGERRDARLAGP